MHGRQPTRAMLLGGAALVVLAFALWQPALARALAAILLVLVLPGVAITAVVFPPGRLHGAEWVALSLGTSLAVAALGGLVLNWTPWGLTPGTWGVLLAGITLGAGGIAVRRWWEIAAQDTAGPGGPLATVWADMAVGRWDAATRRLEVLAVLETLRPRRLPLSQGLMLGAAALVTIAAVGVARTGAAAAPTPGFTQLWLLPVAPDLTTVRLGVRNEERVRTEYQLVLEVDGELISDWPAFMLAPGETWETLAVLPDPSAGGDQVRAVLTPLDGPAGAPQWVSLWRSYESP